MSRMNHRYPQEIKDRAVRLVLESRDEYESEWKAIESVATKLGIGSTETLRKWVRRGEVDAGHRPGVSTQESTEVRKLRAENRELRRANEILKAAAGFFAAEFDRPQR
jgi:transposase